MIESKPSVAALLAARLPAKHADAALEHFRVMVERFQQGNWERAIAKAGKFIEAVLKALWGHLGNPVPKSKEFKVDAVIRGLEQTQSAAAEDSVRLTIPRACRFVYEVASNRGARHDPDEINPNQMDANAVISLSSWILGELVRYAQKGAIDPSKAAEVVAGLSEKRFPVMEIVDGRTYFHFKGLSGRDVALLALWQAHPGRVQTADLVKVVRRHGSSLANAKMGISRLDRVVDDDGHGNLRLLIPGILEAEKLLATAKQKGGK